MLKFYLRIGPSVGNQETLFLRVWLFAWGEYMMS